MYSLDSGKCKDGNEVLLYCHTKGCTASPLICGQEKCVCRLVHNGCQLFTQAISMIKKLQNKKKKGTLFLQSLLDYIDGILKKFIILKQQIQQLQDNGNWMFQEQQGKMFQSLRQSTQSILSSQTLSTAYDTLMSQDTSSSYLIEKNTNTLIKQADLSIDKIIKSFNSFTKCPQKQIKIQQPPANVKYVYVNNYPQSQQDHQFQHDQNDDDFEQQQQNYYEDYDQDDDYNDYY